jgi:integrase/recombinase XerD
MFEQLFSSPRVIREHEEAPYRAERERYLEDRLRRGYRLSGLQLYGRELLWAARRLTLHPGCGFTLQDLKSAADAGWGDRERRFGQALNLQFTRTRFVNSTRPWLRFLGYWHDPPRPCTPFAALEETYRVWMAEERGFTPATIAQQGRCLRLFLLWYAREHRPLAEVTLADIDRFLLHYSTRCTCRASMKAMATGLRAFFGYAASQRICQPSLASLIHGPRLYTQERLPESLSWEEVQRLIASMETDRPQDIWARPMVMLCAVYALRALEVVSLRLDDVDWEHQLLAVRRAKRGAAQRYPLVPSVGNAVLRYLRELRPRSTFRQVFLTLHPPFRPVRSGAVFSMISPRLKKLGITHSHLGSHALRHACAEHLVAEGFSLKEIGDHLGHRSSDATRIYAKVDLAGLREVARFDLGGLI